MSIPADLRYTAEHEWVAVVDGQVRVGVTAHAATASASAPRPARTR